MVEKEKTILEEANEIIFLRAEEKIRQYGPFEESMHKASKIASLLTGKSFSTDDFYKCMIALKLSRLSYNSKRDTILDGIGYLAAYSNFIEDVKKKKRIS